MPYKNWTITTTLFLNNNHFLTGVKVTEVQAMVENHLKDMILKTFDPKKADTIFTEEGEVSIAFSIYLTNTFEWAIFT